MDKRKPQYQTVSLPEAPVVTLEDLYDSKSLINDSFYSGKKSGSFCIVSFVRGGKPYHLFATASGDAPTDSWWVAAQEIKPAPDALPPSSLEV